jgi:hypothetical protein
LLDVTPGVFDRQAEYDRLAETLRQHLDLAQLRKLCFLTREADSIERKKA